MKKRVILVLIALVVGLLFVRGLEAESKAPKPDDDLDLEDVFAEYAAQKGYPGGMMPLEDIAYWSDVCHRCDWDPHAIRQYMKDVHG